MLKLIGAIDQGTTSTRFILYNVETFQPVFSHQIEFQSIVTQPGWCEHDPLVIMETVNQCIENALKSVEGEFSVVAIGITNQRETTVAWDVETGKPLCNALVWMDTRTTATIDAITRKYPGLSETTKKIAGLPVSTYFSAVKMRWLLDNVESVKKAASKGSLRFGTIDSWIIWNLTDGAHVTDVTNASRTMLMNLKSCNWDSELLEKFEIPLRSLPQIKSSSETFGVVTSGGLKGVPISGVLGDQQASLVGHQCFVPGQAKNTYGTGSFMLFNVGETPVSSNSGLLTTVGYQLGPKQPVVYALEGSIAIAGSAVTWLRDKLNLISTSKEIGDLAAAVPDSAGVYFVPALTGLLAPYWDPSARGIITGLSQFTSKHHIARALLEAVSLQSWEILEIMQLDAHTKLHSLKVDGGMTNSDLFLQIQSDILGITVNRPVISEMTALGAAYAAAVGINILNLEGGYLKHGTHVLTAGNISRFDPQWTFAQREQKFAEWKVAVSKALTTSK